MFCRNCGNEMPDGTLFCPKCGYRSTVNNSDPSPDTPSYDSGAGQPGQQPYQGQPVQQNWGNSGQVPPQYGTPNPYYQPKPPKKRKKTPFVIGGIAAAAVLIGGVCIANASAVSNFIKRTFSSPEKYYRQVEETAMAAEAESIGKSYDVSLEQLERIKASGNQNADLTLRLEDGGRSLLGTVVPADLSWLDEVSLSINGFVSDSTMESSMELFLNGSQTPLASLFAAADWTYQEAYLKIPELSTAYLGVDLEQCASDYDMVIPPMNGLSEMFIQPFEYCPNGETLANLITRYYAPLLNNTTSVKKSKEVMNVGTISQELLVLEATTASKDLYNTAYQILEQLQQDKDLEQLIRKSAQQANLLDNYDEVPDEDTVYYQFLTSIQEAEASLRQNEPADTSQPFLTNKIWVDNSGKIIGREITAGTMNESIPLLSYQRPMDGNNFELNLSVFADESTVTISGDGSEAKGITNATYKISVDNYPMVTVTVADLDTKKAEEGYMNGSVTLHPESGLAMMAEGEVAPMLNNYSLKMTLDQTKERSICDYTVLSADLPLFTLSAQTVLDGTGKKAMPSSEDTLYNALSEDDLMTYFTNVNWDSFLANLRSSGIPSEYLEPLEYQINDFREMLDYYSN